jgi:branched-subunit amino acid aminotransferase/4-amino-4-deoxychorismate lyase
MRLGLIETVRVRDGEAPLWGLHLRRLLRSCRELGIPFPGAFDVPSGGRDRVHRLEVSAGGVEVTERAVEAVDSVRLATSEVVHQPYLHKTTDRGQFDRAIRGAHEAGADDALLLAEGGWVAEAGIWSVLWWEGQRLCAPPFSLGILAGVARSRIAELTNIEERRVPRAGLNGHPLLVANAVRGIVEVVSLDGVPALRSDATRALSASFWP